MRDEDVERIIAPLLETDEKLIWAEKTAHHTQDLHKQWFQPTRKERQLLTIAMIIGMVGLSISFNVPPGINNWGTSSQILLSNLLSSASLSLFLLGAVLLFLDRMLKGRLYTVGAYGLTTKRLFEFDRDLNIIKQRNASRVRHVRGSEGVLIGPIGARGFRNYQLGLMDNSTLTINYLHRQIMAARDEKT